MKKFAALLMLILCAALCLALPAQADITLYAQSVSEDTCTITFVTNAPPQLPNMETPDPISAAKGSTVTIPQKFRNSSGVKGSGDQYWFFHCWNTKADGTGVNYPEQKPITVSGDITLYGVWKIMNLYTEPVFSVQAEAGDHGVGEPQQLVANQYVESAYTVPNNTYFTANGNYDFAGWKIKGADDTVFKPGDTIYLMETTTTLVARWQPKKVINVTFNSNASDATGTMNQQPFADGVAQKLSKNAFNRTGYTFTGWNTQADGKGTGYTDEQEITLTESITLYAQWQPKNYTVTFNANGGTGAMAQQTFTHDVPQKLSKNAFNRTEYTFTGWNTQADGKGTGYTDGQEITLTESITLYARWTPKPITVINPQDVVVQEGQNATFTVQAEGENLKYQWYVDVGDSTGLKPISGMKFATLTLENVTMEQNGYKYACEVSNEATSKMSGAATLSVSPKPLPPQTGDRSNLTLWLALCAISCVGMATLILHGRKKKA